MGGLSSTADAAHANHPQGCANPATTALQKHSLIKYLAAFFLGQGLLQLINAVTNLYMVRVMSIDSYAQYNVALAFQTSATALSNLGITDAIIPLVGVHAGERWVIGKYVQAAMHLRRQLFLFTAPLLAAAFVFIGIRHAWSAPLVATLTCTILCTIYVSVTFATYAAPLIIARQIGRYYSSQLIPAIARLFACAAMGTVGLLTAAWAAALNAGASLMTGFLARGKSKQFVEIPATPDPAARREVISFVLPTLPAAVFSSFQPQIGLFLISFSGATADIAEAAALAKIALLFFVFNVFNTQIIEPYVARQSADRLPAALARIITGFVAAAALISLLAFAVPAVFLALLGPKYAQLRDLIGWMVLSASINVTANALWIINRARQWVFFSGSILEICLLVISQATFASVWHIKSAGDFVALSIIANCAHLTAHAFIMRQGFTRRWIRAGAN
jgi:O-antigen/teichoic acid export membrane protein